jgi:hypothetical protein
VEDQDQLKISLDGTGSAHLIVDILGYYSRAEGNAPLGNGLAYLPLNAPTRVHDSRQVPNAPLTAGDTDAITVRGVAGVPATAEAIAVNVTAINPTEATHLTIFPTGTVPGTSNINIVPGQVVARLSQLEIANDGRIRIYNSLGTVNYVVDVVGFYVAPSSFSNDGRSIFSGSVYLCFCQIPAGATVAVDATPAGEGVGPKYGTRAVYLSLYAPSSSNGHLVVHRDQGVKGTGSNLNYINGGANINGAIAPTSTDGTFHITNPTAASVWVNISLSGYVLT